MISASGSSKPNVSFTYPQPLDPVFVCRMTFEIEEAEYEALTVSDPTFPPHTFAMLADNSRVDAYQAALQRAVLRLRETGEGAPR